MENDQCGSGSVAKVSIAGPPADAFAGSTVGFSAGDAVGRFTLSVFFCDSGFSSGGLAAGDFTTVGAAPTAGACGFGAVPAGALWILIVDGALGSAAGAAPALPSTVSSEMREVWRLGSADAAGFCAAASAPSGGSILPVCVRGAILMVLICPAAASDAPGRAIRDVIFLGPAPGVSLGVPMDIGFLEVAGAEPIERKTGRFGAAVSTGWAAVSVTGASGGVADPGLVAGVVTCAGGCAAPAGTSGAAAGSGGAGIFKTGAVGTGVGAATAAAVDTASGLAAIGDAAGAGGLLPPLGVTGLMADSTGFNGNGFGVIGVGAAGAGALSAGVVEALTAGVSVVKAEGAVGLGIDVSTGFLGSRGFMVAAVDGGGCGTAGFSAGGTTADG
jgi:hypothetical protein